MELGSQDRGPAASVSAISSGEARKEGLIAEARCASKLIAGRGPGPVQVLNDVAGSYSGLSGH